MNYSSGKNLTLRILSVTALGLLASCQDFEHLTDNLLNKKNSGYMANVGRQSWDKPQGMAVDPGYWDEPANTTGSPKIVINLRLQEATFYKGSTIIGKSPISTGKDGFNTPTGTYKVIQKDAHYKSGTYGYLRKKGTNEVLNTDFNTKTMKIPAGCWYDPAEMPFFLRFTGGYGMHAGFLPGYAASHGCVRMLPDMAEKFFENAKVGTPVIVTKE